MSSETPSDKAAEENNQDSLIGHLVELRGCVIRAVAVLLVLMLGIIPFAGFLYTWLAQPLLDELAGGELIAIGVLDPFIIQITTAFFFGFWLALPYILFEVWRFVAPGLYKNEKQLILPLLVSSTALFSLGMAFAYFLVFKVVFGFIAGVVPDSVQWTPDISEYFAFLVKIFLGFGLAFETPVVVFMLVRSGMVELESMRRARPYIIVGAFIAAAVLTPPDVISQFMLAVPCWLLYEVGLLLAPKKKDEAEDDAEDNAKEEATKDA